MNWVDLVIILSLIYFVYDSLDKSFIGEVLDFLSFLAAFFLSLRFYTEAAAFYQFNFQIPHSFAGVLGFATIWFLVETILFISLQIVLPRLKNITSLDQKLHPLVVMPAFLRGLIFITIILVLLGTFPIQPKVKLAIQQSRLGAYILTSAQQLEGPLKNIFGGITNETLTFFTIKPNSNENVNLGFKTADFKPRADLESQMVELVNQERVQRGFIKLTFDSKLQEIGRNHSSDMFERGYFSHYSPEGKTVADRAKENNISFLVIGENLAYAPNLQLAHNGLMNSPGHRANILSEDYNKIGVGIMDGGVYGIMFTQVFSN